MLNRDGIVGKAYLMAFKIGVVLLSIDTFLEFIEVCTRPKFSKDIPEASRKEIIDTFLKYALYVQITEKITDCIDPKDNKFLELAVCGKADVIVSSDLKHLLPMSPYRGIPILTPKDFIAKYSIV